MPQHIRKSLIISFMLASVLQGSGAGPHDEALYPILHTLDQAGLSGSLQFSGRCALIGAQDFPEFPLFHPTVTGGSPLEVLRRILASDRRMHVTLSAGGTVRMIESGLEADLLQVKISHISFEGLRHGTAYEPNSALSIILRTPEIMMFMQAHNIEWPFHGEGLPGSSKDWPKDSPHISQPIDNLTLGDALDRILRTFPGIWIYENCPQLSQRKRMVYLRFYYLRQIGNSAPFVDE